MNKRKRKGKNMKRIRSVDERGTKKGYKVRIIWRLKRGERMV